MKTKFQVAFFVVLFVLLFVQQANTQSNRCPDLIIQSITMSPTNPTTSDNIKFKVTVKNIGTAAAGPSVIGIRVGGETNPKTYSIPGLAPNASRTVVRIQRLNVAQAYRTTAYADHSGRIRECNERNNTKYINFRVTRGCSDLIIHDISMSPTNPTTSDTIKFRVTVKNIGNAASGPSVLGIRVGGETNPKTYSIPGLAPNATRIVFRSERLNVAQNYRTTAYADHSGRVQECEERNNTKYINFRVTEGCSDLIIQNISMSPTNPTTSSTIRFRVTVKNIGTAAAGPSVLGIRVGGETNPKTYSVPGLAPNASRSVVRTERLNVAQAYRTTAYADYGNRVKNECDERNNTKYINFRVRGGQTPGSSQGSPAGAGSDNSQNQNQNTPPGNDNNQNQGLICYNLKIESIRWEPVKPKYSGKDKFKIVKFFAKIKNTGTGESPRCKVKLNIGKYSLVFSQFPRLNPGQHATKIRFAGVGLVNVLKIVRKNFNMAERLDPFRKTFNIHMTANIIAAPAPGCPPSTHIFQVWHGDLIILK